MSRAQITMPVLLFVVFGSLIAAAMTWVLLDQAWEPIFAMANNSSNTTQSSRGLSLAEDAWNNWAFFILTLIFVLGTAGAAASRRVR